MNKNLEILLINIGGTRKNVYQDLSKVFSAIDTTFLGGIDRRLFKK